MLFVGFSFQTAQAVDEVEPSNEVEIVAYRGDPMIRAYLEYVITDDVAPWLSVSKSRKFGEVTVGLAYYITPEMEIGFGIGTSRYAVADDDRKSSHRVASAWWYWKSDAVESEITVSRYGNDPEPWYYRVYGQIPVTGNWFAGLYGEQGIGWGPRVSWSPAKNISVWVVPLIKKEGDNKLVGGLQFLF